LRQLNTHEGSRVLTFDPNDPTQVNPTQHQDVSLSVYRVGARLKLGDAGDLLVSAIESDRDQNIDDQVEAGFGPIHSLSLTNDTGHQVEAMISDRSPLGFLRAGGGVAEVNRVNDSTFTSSLGFPFEAGLHNTQDVSYAYVDLRRPLGRTLDLELRFGYDSVEQTQTSRSALTPGAGLLWHPSPAFLARVAAGRVLKRPLVVNQTIAPVELAGFDLVLDEFDATLSDQVGVAAEYRPVDSLRLGVELEKRWLSNQDLAESGTVLDDQKELYGLGYVYWLPFPRLAVTLAAEVDRYRRHWRDTDEGPIRVDTLNAPLSLRYFDPSGLFAGVTARLLAQRVSAKNGDELQQNDSATNPIVDAEIGYRLAGGGATATLSVNNLFDRDVRYQDAAFRTEERDLPPQFLPTRTILGSVTLSF
jgi:outer membrane receptor protein involved in Fe transport